MKKDFIKKIEIKKKYVYVTLNDGAIIKHKKYLVDLNINFRQETIPMGMLERFTSGH